MLPKKKAIDSVDGFLCSGDWTRTSDLRVMSPTSYLLLYPAMWTANIRRFIGLIKSWLGEIFILPPGAFAKFPNFGH